MQHPALACALGCLLPPALAQTFVPLCRPLDVGISSAFDPFRRRLVLFGDDGATWELAGGELLPRANLVGGANPPTRGRPAMCYDELRRTVLMFGGFDESGERDDTWTYDGLRWTQLAGVNPPARTDAAITWDNVRGRVLMWGGQGSGLLTDTWEHDGTSWLPRSPATTPGPNSGRMTFDRQRGVAVLVTPSGMFGAPVETWEWNGIDWALRNSSGPNTNSNATLAFDSLRNRTVLAGGVPNDRIWEWNGSVWSAASLPAPFRRINAASWFDPDCSCVTIAGGTAYEPLPGGSVQAVGAIADRWQWNGQTLSPTHPPFGPLRVDAVLPDPLRTRTIVFGGEPGGGPSAAETWELRGHSWTRLPAATNPGPRWWAATAYDIILGEGILFGGFDFGTFLGDTWTFGSGGWVQRSSTGPAPRAGAALAFDAIRSVVVLFGGRTAPQFVVGSARDDTWEWNGVNWTQRSTSLQPSPRSDAAMAFDPQLGRVLLFGGTSDAAALSIQQNDTWAWDGAQWVQQSPSTIPPALSLISLSSSLSTYDSMLVGVLSPGLNPRQQVWSFTGGNWVLRRDEQTPIARRRYPCVTGPYFDTLVCMGGTSELTFQAGEVAAVGAGCGSPGATLLVRSRPKVGSTSGIELTANPNRAAVFGLALSSGSTPLGGGCTLWLAAGFLGLFQPTDALGFAEQPLLLPANPALRGLDLFAQAAVLEPLSSGGLVLTLGLRLRLGD